MALQFERCQSVVALRDLDLQGRFVELVVTVRQAVMQSARGREHTGVFALGHGAAVLDELGHQDDVMAHGERLAGLRMRLQLERSAVV